MLQKCSTKNVNTKWGIFIWVYLFNFFRSFSCYNFSQIYFFIPDFLFLMLLLFKRPIDQFSWPNFSYFYDLFKVLSMAFQAKQNKHKIGEWCISPNERDGRVKTRWTLDMTNIAINELKLNVTNIFFNIYSDIFQFFWRFYGSFT